MSEFKRHYLKDQFGQDHISVVEAKEREAKLTEVAMNAIIGSYGTLSSIAVIDVYKEAGLEELK